MNNTYSSDEKLRSLEIARDLFSELLLDDEDYPSDVEIELERDLAECEKRIKKLKPLREEIIIQEKATEERTLPLKTHYIWTNFGKNEATLDEIENHKKAKTLFVDADRGIAYKNSVKIAQFDRRPQAFKILECFLKNKGKASLKQILAIIDPESRIEADFKIKEKIITPVSRLRSILESENITLSYLKNKTYYLDESIDFVLVQEKIN